MTRLTAGALVALLSFHAAAARAADPLDPGARILRLERMIKTTLAHHPGERDEAVTEVGLWTNADLRLLRVDELLLQRLLRQPGLRMSARVTDDRSIPEYTAWQVKRLKEIGDDYRPRNRDDNLMVRMALLHGEVAMSNPDPAVAPEPRDSGRIKIQVGDGESRGFKGIPLHWDMARALFDVLKDNPRAADVARRWYIATSTLMQNEEAHDTSHLKHGREMFPDDAELQFLSGCQQEAYASAAIQAAARSAVLPTGYHVDVPPEGAALKSAEDFFRRTLQLNPQHKEARMHLGRVLVLRGKPAEATDELRKTAFDDDESRYFREMFLGSAEEGAGHFDAARDAYLRAAAIESGAQSPYLALSALAVRQGDRKGALREIDHVLAMPAAVERHSTDSWWVYRVTQARHVDELFETLYGSLQEKTP